LILALPSIDLLEKVLSAIAAPGVALSLHAPSTRLGPIVDRLRANLTEPAVATHLIGDAMLAKDCGRVVLVSLALLLIELADFLIPSSPGRIELSLPLLNMSITVSLLIPVVVRSCHGCSLGKKNPFNPI